MSNLDLTPEEQARVRAALQFLRRRTGGWDELAKALGFVSRTLANIGVGKTVTPKVVFRVARFARVSVEDVLTGNFPAPGTCPHCGHVEERQLDETGSVAANKAD